MESGVIFNPVLFDGNLKLVGSFFDFVSSLGSINKVESGEMLLEEISGSLNLLCGFNRIFLFQCKTNLFISPSKVYKTPERHF